MISAKPIINSSEFCPPCCWLQRLGVRSLAVRTRSSLVDCSTDSVRGVRTLQVVTGFESGHDIKLIEHAVPVPVAFVKSGRLARQVLRCLKDLEDVSLVERRIAVRVTSRGLKQ